MEATMNILFFVLGFVAGGLIVPFGLFCYALMTEGQY